MNKLATFSSVLTVASAILISDVDAKGNIIEVNNLSRETVDVYVRGEGVESPVKPEVALPGKTKKDITQTRPEAYMDVVVVSQGSAPDWNLTGGACKHLLTTTDHTVVIDDSMGGLKFSCETIK